MYKIFEKLAEVKGVSPYFVSKETGVANATISAWKRGQYHPKDDKLARIADYFGVPLSYLKGQQKKVQCPDCHMSYNPIDKESYDKHAEFHERFKAIEKHYCVIIPSREEVVDVRKRALDVLNDIRRDMPRRLSAFNSYAKYDFLMQLYDTGFMYDEDLDSHSKKLAEQLRPDHNISVALCNEIRAYHGVEPYKQELSISITEREYRLVCNYRDLPDDARKLVDKMLGVE